MSILSVAGRGSRYLLVFGGLQPRPDAGMNIAALMTVDPRL